jgi:hypothetical protein
VYDVARPDPLSEVTAQGTDLVSRERVRKAYQYRRQKAAPDPTVPKPRVLPVVQSSYLHYHDGMRAKKERLTVTVDRDLIEVAEEAVRAGDADSVSAWVNKALSEHAAKERRLRALAAAIEAYEAEFGEITPEDMQARIRADRSQAVVVRGSPGRTRKRRRSGAL